MRIDDGGDGIGCVVEAVHELEAQRDQQGNKQHQEWQVGRGAACLDVGIDAVGDVEQPGRHHPHEEDQRQRVEALVEVRT
jgi:hypothetical protein